MVKYTGVEEESLLPPALATSPLAALDKPMRPVVAMRAHKKKL